MNISVQHLNLPLRHPFTLGNGSSRTHTAISILSLEKNGITATGEAAMPPYLGENHETVDAFLAKLDLTYLQEDLSIGEIHAYVDSLHRGNSAIKAAIDIAFHDWFAKTQNKTLRQLVGTSAMDMPISTGTIGITPIPDINQKVNELLEAGFKKIKVKLGGPADREMIQSIRKYTDLPLTVDINQGWKDLETAKDMSFWLADQGVILLEQPFIKEDLESMGRLKALSPIPVFADESCQRLSDIECVQAYVDGINIKLMKCTGIYEAIQMVNTARRLGLQIMLGCMTETSCATYAALSIAPLFDMVDIDGPWILKEQPFKQPIIEAGKILIPTTTGLGIQ